METLLTVELVPEPLWYHNLRSRFTQERWDELRRECYRKAEYRCEICWGKGPKWPVECHEVWEYDDENHVQRLIRLIALCPECHEVKHLGRAISEGDGVRVTAHLRAINSWSSHQTAKHIEEAFELWRERNKHEWTQDISIFEGEDND